MLIYARNFMLKDELFTETSSMTLNVASSASREYTSGCISVLSICSHIFRIDRPENPQ
jgi:hypothetical protein